MGQRTKQTFLQGRHTDSASLVAQRVKHLPAMQVDLGSVPRSGRSSGEGNGNPLQYLCLENPVDREAGRLQSMGSQKVTHD